VITAETEVKRTLSLVRLSVGDVHSTWEPHHSAYREIGMPRPRPLWGRILAEFMNQTSTTNDTSHPPSMVLEAGYPGTTGFRKVVKVTVMVKKKEGISDDDFIKHYNQQHAQMAAPVLQKHKIISYSLVCLLVPNDALSRLYQCIHFSSFQ
jgi:hypothetical protein